MKGSLLIEFLIALGIFLSAIASLSLLVFQNQDALANARARFLALEADRQHLEEALRSLRSDFDHASSSGASIVSVDNFTKKAIVGTLSVIATDTRESFGQSSCRPDQEGSWKNPSVFHFDAGEGEFTDVDIVGSYAYVSSNTAVAADFDLFIFDISDPSAPFLISSLNTGPGVSSLHVAGDYAYLGNTSINSQLQIVDISDREAPFIASAYKLPGIYNDGTTVANTLFYKADIVYLGTQKSQIAELHAIDVSDPYHPAEMASYEIGNGVNDIISFKDIVYVASPNKEDLKSFRFDAAGFHPIFSFDGPGNLVNGKRLSLFLDTLYMGRTAGSDELYALDLPFFSDPLHFSVGSSVQGVIAYGKLLFVLASKKEDGFAVFDISEAIPRQLNEEEVVFESSPINFDCDKDLFAVVEDGSSSLTLITHAP